MKCFILFFLLTISTAFSQSENKTIPTLNPDGSSLSLHLTPYWIDGEIDQRKMNSKFSFKAEVWFPVDENLTIKFIQDQTSAGILKLNKTGITLSYYFQ